MARSKHDEVAERIAKQEGTTYNQGPGADIQSRRRVMEVENPQTIGDAARQLAGYQKAAYVVPTDPKAVPKAVEHYQNTTIGVMSPSGKIVKRRFSQREFGPNLGGYLNSNNRSPLTNHH